MTELEKYICMALDELKPKLQPTTFESRIRYFNQLKKLALNLQTTEPTQKLFLEFLKDTHGSLERSQMHRQCVVHLDRLIGKHFIDENGKLLNLPPLPSKKEAESLFTNNPLPWRNPEIVPLEFLVVWTALIVREQGFTVSTVGQYLNSLKVYWNFSHERNHQHFNYSIHSEFLEKNEEKLLYSEIKEWKKRITKKAVLTLKEVVETGKYTWHLINQKDGVKLELKTPELRTIEYEYLSEMRSRALRNKTISLYDYVFRRIMLFLDMSTINELSGLDYNDADKAVRAFAHICCNRSMSTIIPIVRDVFSFLNRKGYISKDIGKSILSCHHHKQTVDSFLTQEEEKTLVNQLPNESKRDQAIILLALRLGLRQVDIINLKFSEIDWLNDRIVLIQKKTGRPLVLPLLNDVGNTIMDYIITERSKVRNDYPYIFLRQQAPHKKLSSTYAINKAMLTKTNLQLKHGKKLGIHLYRHTIAYRLLENNVPLQVITDVLGHSNSEADKPYLSLNESMMKSCALDLTLVGYPEWSVVYE